MMQPAPIYSINQAETHVLDLRRVRVVGYSVDMHAAGPEHQRRHQQVADGEVGSVLVLWQLPRLFRPMFDAGVSGLVWSLAAVDRGIDVWTLIGRMARVTSKDSFVPLGDAARLVLVSEEEIEAAALQLVRHV